jgi:trypsin-like peptidase
LPAESSATTRPLEGRALWATARKSFVRVGYYYLCKGCKRWRLNLSCGFFLTEDGAVATAYHVLEQDRTMKRGCLVVVDDDGTVYPVGEIAAANKISDVCILRVKTIGKTDPLPLSEDARPGDRAFCFSDPMGERSYFSAGTVNRLAAPARLKNGGTSPLVLDVSTDWAPGSSGAAVIDECGNAIGLVSAILALQEDVEAVRSKSEHSSPTWMVLHEAVSAREVSTSFELLGVERTTVLNEDSLYRRLNQGERAGSRASTAHNALTWFPAFGRSRKRSGNK